MITLFYTLIALLTITSGILAYFFIFKNNKLWYIAATSFLLTILFILNPIISSFNIFVGSFISALGIIYIYAAYKGKVSANISLSKISVIGIIFGLFMLFSGAAFTSYTNSGFEKQYAKENKEAKKEELKERKEQKKEAQEEKDREQYADANYLAYKYKLEDVPKDTNYTITKAYMDPSNSYKTTIHVSDDVSSHSGDTLKRYIKVVFDKFKSLELNYEPLPSKYSRAKVLVIKDNYGNLIAHSSIFGNIKYDFE